MSEAKVYVGSGRMVEFKSGGTALKLSFNEDDLTKLREHLDDGWVRILIGKRREPSASGQTHYGYIDTWRPGETRQDAPPAVPQPAHLPNPPADDGDTGGGELPF